MSRSSRNIRVALAASSFLALLEVFRTGMTRIVEGSPSTVPELIHWVLPLWVSVVLVSPWCAFMAWRFPVRSHRLPLTLLAHLGGAAVFVALHMGLLRLFHEFQRAAHPLPDGVHQIMHRYVFYIGMEMSIYAAIVVVVMLLEARREAAERSVAAERLERSFTTARLEGLQAQMRPHFLFNTLNALAVLARRGDGAAVDHAIGDLGELLRASFDSGGRHEIPLREELELVERYLGLQRIRFPDRLDVQWEVSDEARAALVPALLVQPLVENALEHGLARAQGGRVRIAARRFGDALELEVADDGPGFGDGAGAREGGVGLANTRERLSLLHGARATLELGEAPGGGGRVWIRLPWRTVAPAEGTRT